MAGWRRTTSPLSTLAERRQMEMTSPFAYAHLFSSLPTLKIRQNPPILVRKRGDTPAPPHPHIPEIRQNPPHSCPIPRKANSLQQCTGRSSPKSDKISPFLSDSEESEQPTAIHRPLLPRIRQNRPILVRFQGRDRPNSGGSRAAWNVFGTLKAVRPSLRSHTLHAALSTLAERRQMEITSPFAYAHLFSAQPNGGTASEQLRSAAPSAAKRRNHTQIATPSAPQRRRMETAPPNHHTERPPA